MSNYSEPRDMIKVKPKSKVFWHYCFVIKVAGPCCRFFAVADSLSIAYLGITSSEQYPNVKKLYKNIIQRNYIKK